MRRRPKGVFNTTKEMAVVFFAFAAVIAVVESGGLASWAERLELGPLRDVAIPVTGAWRRVLAPLGLETVRETAIADLKGAGWSDEPAAPIEIASQPAPAPGPAAALGPPRPADLPILGPPAPSPAARPLANATPKATPLPPLPAPPEGRPRVVALAGDSMMTVGLSAVLLRKTAKRADLHLVKAFRSGTGLARPEVFDWMQQYPAMLGAEHPDLVLVAIGGNDGQGFVENGKVLAFGIEEWTEVYRRRSAEFLDMLAAGGARVLWIGLPPMKKDTFNEKIAAINRIAFTVASQNPHATWWNPTPLIGDANGAFREFLTAPSGKTIRLRAADGIHLSDDGAALIVSELLRWIDDDREALGPPAPRPAAATEGNR